jgi:hypothetical protein
VTKSELFESVQRVAADAAIQWLGAIEVADYEFGTVPPIPTWESWIPDCYVAPTSVEGDEIERGLHRPSGEVSLVELEEAFHTAVVATIVDAVLDCSLAFDEMRAS